MYGEIPLKFKANTLNEWNHPHSCLNSQSNTE